MALHRKAEALLALRPDIAVISECAEPARLRARSLGARSRGERSGGERSLGDWFETEPVWIGDNLNKGLAVFGFNGYRPRLNDRYAPYLRYVAPVHVAGPVAFNLLAVWAQNFSAGITRKRQSGPLRRALSRYREFLSDAPVVIAGDWNNNVNWDRPGWRINHQTKVDMLARMGLVSAYHETTGEAQGAETTPTIYWRDRTRDGPTYHIDYIFLTRDLMDRVGGFEVGGFDDWCGNGLSDHVPLLVDIKAV